MQMAPSKTQARKYPLTKSVSNNVNVKKSLMIPLYVFISKNTWSFITDSKLTKTKPESCVRNVHLLEKKATRTTERKKLRNLFFRWKKGKRKFLHANYLKFKDNFNITPIGVGLLPTHHDKNNERSSAGAPVLRHSPSRPLHPNKIPLKKKKKTNDRMNSYNHMTHHHLL